MAFSRRLGVVWIAGASWLIAVGCDDSEDQVTGPAGAGAAGEAPGGGTASVAGSQNDGGKAGASSGSGGMTPGGQAGGGGDAGHGGGGDGGAAGAGGGDMAGAAGGAGDTSGVGGAGGQSGAGGEGGAFESVAVPHCSFTCDSDDDCLIDGDDTEKCNLTRHRCEDPTQACTSDAGCLVALSAWFKPCTNASNCTAIIEACVDAGGQGFCAPLPVASACTGSNVPRTLPRFDTQGTVEVCAHPDPRCFNRVCRPGCGAPSAPCGIGNGDTCNTVTGLCDCRYSTECDATGICGSNGQCQECAVDADCAANVTDTACIGGKCGCASAATCAAIDPGYESAPAVCQ
jgi:hypothetical protein